jgi:uncharacterized protein (TIGR02466 family)|tara:strand:+ start:1394 stop:2140 length:747 start_codon:yes stop_codon:yes gene_type:complete
MKPSQIKPTQYSPAQHRVMNLFPTPFLRGQLGFPENLLKKDIDKLISSVSKRDGKDKLSDYTSYFDQDIRDATHKLPWFTDFANIMKDTYIEFIRTQFNKDVSHLNRSDIHFFAWINRYESEHQHDIHNHVDSYISGTYYVNDTDRPIKFWNPNMAAQYAHNGREDVVQFDDLPNMQFTGCEGFQSDMMFQPSAGDFLLWPSYVMHSVPPSTSASSSTRYSISFNLKHTEPMNDTEHGDAFSYGNVFK